MAADSRDRESLAQTWAAKSAICAGVVGAVAGFVYAWTVHESTAWFGIIEVGVPAFVLGALVGACSGAAVGVKRRLSVERRTQARRP